MTRVVLIHGVGQQSSTAQLQLEAWLPSMVKGVLLSGHPAAGQVAADLAASIDHSSSGTVAMAFYGDLFLPDGVQGVEAPVEAETLTVADSFAEALLRTAVARGEPRLRTEAAALLGQGDLIGDGRQAAGARIRGAMARLDSNRWVSARIFGLAQRARPDLEQVARYLTDDALRAQIQARVERLLDSDLCLMIAHSLGSIVGWEVCRNSEKALPILLTIGSPLGMDTVVYPLLRPTPPVFPSSVQRWVNVAHPDDIVAVEPRLAQFFPSVDSRRVEDHNPISQRDHHNAITYLEQPVAGKAVVEALR
jgi:hypothetical protein